MGEKDHIFFYFMGEAIESIYSDAYSEIEIAEPMEKMATPLEVAQVRRNLAWFRFFSNEQLLKFHAGIHSFVFVLESSALICHRLSFSAILLYSRPSNKNPGDDPANLASESNLDFLQQVHFL